MTLYNPEQECSLAMPRWGIGWDVFCWIGQRRFSRHWSVPQIRNELRDTYDLKLSDDAIEDHIASYQNMVAARHQRPQELATLYRDTKQIVLTIDGLQPEKGHETLYVVREVTQSRVWFAEPLLSGATDEIRRLFVRAHEIADGLGLKVVLFPKRSGPTKRNRVMPPVWSMKLSRVRGYTAQVREGATLIPTLDAHALHPSVFTEADLTGFTTATAPESQLASPQRHGVMQKARSKKENYS